MGFLPSVEATWRAPAPAKSIALQAPFGQRQTELAVTFTCISEYRTKNTIEDSLSESTGYSTPKNCCGNYVKDHDAVRRYSHLPWGDWLLREHTERAGRIQHPKLKSNRRHRAKKSVTALIPAFFGGGLLICGLLAMKESLLKHAMHGAAMIGLLGALAGAGRGAMGLGKFFSGDPSLNQRSFAFVWLMAIICAVFVALCVRSFIAARKAREAATAGSATG